MATSLEASLKLRDQFTSTLQKVDSSMQKATKSMTGFKEKVAGPVQALKKMTNAAAESFSKLQSNVKSGMSTAGEVVKTGTERIITLFGSFGNRISSRLNLSGIKDKFSEAFNKVQSDTTAGVSAVGSAASALKSKLSGPMDSAVAVVKTGAAKIKNFLKDSGDAFKIFGADAKTGLSKIESAFTPLGNFLKAGAVAGTAALVGLGKKIYDVAGGFDTQMSRVQAISGATGDSFQQMRDQAIELGAKTAFSATESAAGMENLASAGFNAQEVIAAMPGLLDLAAVSGGDVALASENAATALRGFGLDAGQAGHVADVFARAAADTNAEVGDMGEAMKYVAPVASSMGLSIEEVAASIGIMSDAGVKGSQAGTALRGALSRLAKPTDAMQETMGQLGLNFYDANGQMKPLTDQVGMLQGAFKGLTPEQQQNALVTLYGQESLSGMMALVAKGPEALGKLTNSLKDSSGAAAEMAEIMQNNLQSKLEQLGGAFESGLINIGDRIFPIIKPVIEEFTTFIEKTLSADSIGKFFDKLAKYGAVLKSAFDDVKGPVSDAFGAIKDSLNELNGGFGSEKSVGNFKDFVSGITEGIKKLADFAEKHADSIAKIIDMLPKIAGAFLAFKIGKGILTPFLNFGSGILTLTKGFGKLGGGLGKAIGGIFKKLPGKDATGGGSGDLGATAAVSPLQTFLGTMNGFAKGATTLVLIFGVIKLIEELAQALKDINDKVPSDLSKLAPKFLNMGIALVGMGAFVKIAERFSKDTKGAVRGLAVVAGISGNLILAAIAMKEINDKVPDDIGNFASKMANMGIALAGMGILVLAAGKLTSMNPTGAIAGLAVIAGISLELMLAAEAMQQVDEKVPDDIGSFASKIANIAIAIGGMGILVGVVGALMATGIGALIGGAGLLAVAALAGEIMLVAEAIAQMDAKVPDDLSSVKTKIDNIAETIGYFTAANLGGVLDLFSNAVGVLNVSVVTTGINKFIDLAESLQQFDNIVVSNTAGTKIEQIQAVIESIAKSDLGDLISSGFTAIDTAIVNTTLQKLVEIGTILTQFESLEFNAGTVTSKIDSIQSVIDSLSSGGILSKISSIFGGGLDTAKFAIAKDAFHQLVDIGNSISTLQGITVNAEDAKSKVKAINSVVEALGSSNLIELIGTMIKSAQLTEVISTLDAMFNLIAPINQIADADVKALIASQKIERIGTMIEALGTANLTDYFGTMIKAAQLGEVKSSLTAMFNLITPINQIADADIQAAAAVSKINQISDIIQAVGTGNIGTLIGGMVKNGQLEEAKNSLAMLFDLVSSVNQIATAEIQSAAAIAKINEIKTVLSALNGIGSETGDVGSVATGFLMLSSAFSSVATTSAVAAAGLNSVATAFQTMNSATTAGMAAFNVTVSSGMNKAIATVKAGNASIVSAFSGLRGQLQSAGAYAMSGLSAGIQSGAGSAITAAQSVANQVSATIRSALKIHSPSRVMMEIGGFVGAGLANGISATKDLVASASNALAFASVPEPLGDLSANGTITNSVQLDDSEISRLKASASQQIVVNQKQVTPQVTINIENKDGQPIDHEALLKELEDKVLEMAEADLS